MVRVRLVDVAQRVGVSAKTVSNVVNGTGMVGAEVRARVLTAIDELGYRPNIAARQLRTGASGMVALAMPDLKEAYFAEFASSFFSTAQRRGMRVVVSQTHGDLAAERDACEGIAMPELDGIVMSPLALTTHDLARRRSTTPLVLIGEHGESLSTDRICHVGVDNVEAAAAATRVLISKGRRRIAAIGAQHAGSTATSRLRLAGYRHALAQAGLPYDPALVGYVKDFRRADGSHAAESLISSAVPFDAIFCFSDTLAFGAIYTLATHGVRVPEQVIVAGFDDIEEGRYSVPPFATIKVNGTTASEMILDIIAAGTRSHTGGHRDVPFTVIDRTHASGPDSPTH